MGLLRRRRPDRDLLEELHTARTGDTPLRPPGRGPTQRFQPGSLGLLGVFVAVVVAAVFAEQGKPRFPVVPESCTTGAMAITPTEVSRRDPVRYTVVGPNGPVLVALDTAAVSADGVATPSAPGAVTQVFPEQTMVGCRLQGTFPAQVRPGTHEVTAFRLQEGTWTPLARTSLVVR